MPKVGELLKSVREGKGISLEQAAAETKISAFYLEAIEAHNWQVLPAPPYVKGYLRLYASYLGLTPDKVINQYEEETFPPRVETKAKKPDYKLIILGLLFVLCVLLGFFWCLMKGDSEQATSINHKKKDSLGKSVSQVMPPSDRTKILQNLSLVKPEKIPGRVYVPRTS